MTTKIEFNGKDNKVVSYNEFEQLLNTVGMNWFGLKNWSRGDLDLFEEYFKGTTCEPCEPGIRIWNLEFDYSPLYK